LQLLRLIKYFTSNRLTRRVIESVAIGILAGCLAALFFYCLKAADTFVIYLVGGTLSPSPLGEPPLFNVISKPQSLWLKILLPAFGGLASGFLVYLFAPEAEGHGTDAMIKAFHQEDGNIRSRVPIVKGLATIFILATGGSAGREGPIIQMGAGVGSLIARILRLSVRIKRQLLLAGAAAGIGAIFKAPLGGAITAIEIIYKEDFEAEALIPSVISSVSSYAVFSAFFGHATIFGLPITPSFYDLREFAFYLLLSIASALAGILFIRVFKRTRRIFHQLPIYPPLKPALGGLLVGLLGIFVPQILGTGWGEIQIALMGKYGALLLVTIALAKILATSFTVGSGGSGGIFGPSLFIGGMLGGGIGLFGHHYFPAIVQQPEAYILVGMASFFAGIANAPIGALVMVMEMTGAYGLVAPFMLVSIFAILFTQKWSIYDSQLRSRFDSPSHREDLVRDILSEITTAQLWNELQVAPEPIPASTLIKDIPTAFRKSTVPYLLVKKSSDIDGIIESDDYVGVAGIEETNVILATDVASPIPQVKQSDSLRSVLRAMMIRGVNHALVISSAEEKPRIITSEQIESAAERHR